MGLRPPPANAPLTGKVVQGGATNMAGSNTRACCGIGAFGWQGSHNPLKQEGLACA